MIALAVGLLQLATAMPGVLVVRDGGSERAVPIVATTSGPAVRADLLGSALGVSVVSAADDRLTLTLAGVVFDIAEQIPFARVGWQVVPLAGSPYMFDGALHIPLQLVTELLPRYASGIAFDARRSELRVLTRVAGQGWETNANPPPATPRATAPAVSPTPPPARTATPPVPVASTGSATTGNAPRPSAATPAPTRATPPPANTAPRTRKVIVDAGHGGNDPGAMGRDRSGRMVNEKDITLAVSGMLREELVKRGFEVVMTRTRDTLIGLYDRGPIANRNSADLFISIHVNAAAPARNSTTARGFETYFLDVARTEDAKRVAAMENSAIRFETGGGPSARDPLSFILNDMAMNSNMRESSELARVIQRHMAPSHPGPNRGVKQAPFAVLSTAYMPSVLVELGFITNRDEATYLSQAANQRKLAAGIAAATVDYFIQIDRGTAKGDR